MDQERCCLMCIAWVSVDEEEGECRMHPPTRTDGSDIGMWSETFSDGWCMEYQRDIETYPIEDEE